MSEISFKNIKFLQSRLLRWISLNKRQFHWRRANSTDYEIFSSEIMLRRTTAKVVESVFPFFINKYPNFKSLSEADPETLINIIRPLGKYNLKSKLFIDLAKHFVTEGYEKTKIKADNLKKINGLGTYTINAFLCFAKNKKLTIVDSNVIRIYSRYFALSEKFTDSPKNIINIIATRCLPHKKYKDYNMALLDFGALVCTPQSPKCVICPIARNCCYLG